MHAGAPPPRAALALALVLAGCGRAHGRPRQNRGHGLLPKPVVALSTEQQTWLPDAHARLLAAAQPPAPTSNPSTLIAGGRCTSEWYWCEHRLGLGWGFEAWQKFANGYEQHHLEHSNLTRFQTPSNVGATPTDGGASASANETKASLDEDRPVDRRVVAFFLATSFVFVLLLFAQCAVPCFVEPQGPVYISGEPMCCGRNAVRPQRGEVLAFLYRVVHFCFCAVAVIGTSVLLDFSQERTMETFEDPAALEICKRFTAVVLTFVVLWCAPRDDICGAAPLSQYSIAAYTRLLSSMARGLAPGLASFPLLVLAESCKMPMVMLLGVFVPGTTYRAFEYASALLVLMGSYFVVFYDADSAEAAASYRSSSFRGVMLLLVYVISDAFTTNWQATMFENYVLRVGPMMLWLSVFGLIFSLIGFVASTLSVAQPLDSLSATWGLGLSPDRGWVGWGIAETSLAFTIAQFFLLVFIKRYGAVALAGILSARQVAPLLYASVFSAHVLNSLQTLGFLLVFLALVAHVRFSWYADARASRAVFDVKNNTQIEDVAEKVWPTAEQALLDCTCLCDRGEWWRKNVAGSDWGLPSIAIAFLVLVSAGATLVTRTAIDAVPDMPVAFSAVASTVTILCVLPVLILYPASSALRANMIPALAVATLICFVDVATTTMALPLLSLPLQQLMAALVPSVTLLLETGYQCEVRHPLIYVAVAAVTLGSAVVLYGAFGTMDEHAFGTVDEPAQQPPLPGEAAQPQPGQPLPPDAAGQQPPAGDAAGQQPGGPAVQQPSEWSAAQQPNAWSPELLRKLLVQQATTNPSVEVSAMGLALLTTSVKYVLLRGIRRSNPELGSLSLLFWCQIMMPVFVVPWSIAYGELGDMFGNLSSHRTQLWWIAAAVLTGLRLLTQLLVLRFVSATTLAVSEVTGLLLAALVSVVAFHPFANVSFNPVTWERMVLASEVLVPCGVVLYFSISIWGSLRSCGKRAQASVVERAGEEDQDAEVAADDVAADGPPAQVEFGEWTEELESSELPLHFRSATVRQNRDEAAQALFGASEPAGKTEVLPVLVCGYNEDVGEFTHTLGSLANQQLELEAQGWTLRVVIGLDGWAATSASMKQLSERLFPATSAGAWRDELDGTSSTQGRFPDVLGIALRRTLLLSRATDGRRVQLDLTLYIKRENLKKDDTIAMFLLGFVPHGMPAADVVFLTDCGSSFEKNCLLILLTHMIEHPNCAGSTGRPRVAQHCPWDEHMFDSWEAKWCRGAQAAEHEMDAIIRYDFTSKIGFMPVLPGPCNMWRLSLITDAGDEPGGTSSSAVANFDEIMNESKQSDELLKANIRLAEDRLLTLAALAFSARRENVQLNWVPGAVFYYQAEPTFTALFSQRRRWNNGTLACHMDVLINLRRYTRNRSAKFTACLWGYAMMESVAAICGVFAPGITFGIVVVALKDFSELWMPVAPFIGYLLGHQVFLAFYASVYAASFPSPRTSTWPTRSSLPFPGTSDSWAGSSGHTAGRASRCRRCSFSWRAETSS